MQIANEYFHYRFKHVYGGNIWGKNKSCKKKTPNFCEKDKNKQNFQEKPKDFDSTPYSLARIGIFHAEILLT